MAAYQRLQLRQFGAPQQDTDACLGGDAQADGGGAEGVPMNRLLAAILREDLGSFIRKVFATVSPGTRYHHNWHIEAIVLGCLCRVGAQP